MKLDSLTRLRHLAEIATSRHLAATNLADRLRSVRDDRRRVVEHIERIEHPPAGGNYRDRDVIAAQTKRFRAQLADIEATIADLEHRDQDAAAAWQAAKRLETRCLEFARKHDLPVPDVIIGESKAYDGPRLEGGFGMVPNTSGVAK